MDYKSLTDDELTEQWLNAKENETAFNKKRLAIEEEIVSRYPAKEEGSSTITLDSGVKIETTGKLTYKADDMESFVNACNALPVELRPIRVEMKIDETGAKWLRANRADLWQLIASAVTIKPAKVAVKVKV